MLELRVTSGANEGHCVVLHDSTIVLGRDPDCDVCVEDRKASRRHAVVEPAEGNQWILCDLDSTNKTYLNDSPVQRAILKPDDVIRIGRSEITFASIAHTAPSTDEVSEDIAVAVDPMSIQASLRTNQEPGELGVSEALYEIGLHANVSHEPQRFLKQAMAIVVADVAHSAWAWIEWPQGSEQPFEVFGERHGRPLESSELEVSRSLIAKAVEQSSGLISSDLAVDFETSMAVLRHAITSAIAVPVVEGDGKQAVLYLDRIDGQPTFERDEIERLAILGSKIAMHMRNIRLYQQLEKAYDDLQQSQAELVRTERMAGIGRLASGFAHDLNNPLGSMIGFLELAQRALPETLPEGVSDKIPRYLSRAAAAANYCQSLARNLLTFARSSGTGSKPVRGQFDVRKTIDDTIAISATAFSNSQVEVQVHVENDLTLDGDPSSLQQIIMNLVTNAADALSETPDERMKLITVEARELHGNMLLVVSDNGPGIPPALRERIFEPLFTTKEHDRGTGLGLFVVRKIVDESGGSLQLSAPEEGGTKFIIELPNQLAGFSNGSQVESQSPANPLASEPIL